MGLFVMAVIALFLWLAYRSAKYRNWTGVVFWILLLFFLLSVAFIGIQ